MEPDGDFARHLQRLQALAVADAVLQLVRRQVAGVAQQVEELAHLRVHAQAGIHRTQQFGLRGLQQLDAQPRRDVLHDGFDHQAQLEHAAGGVEWEQALGRGAQVGQQGRVRGQEAEVAWRGHTV